MLMLETKSPHCWCCHAGRHGDQLFLVTSVMGGDVTSAHILCHAIWLCVAMAGLAWCDLDTYATNCAGQCQGETSETRTGLSEKILGRKQQRGNRNNKSKCNKTTLF